jgi:hypothetical protein
VIHSLVLIPGITSKEAIGRDRPLTRAELRQVQGVLNRIDRLPFFLQTLFTSRYNFIRRKKSPLGGLYFLKTRLSASCCRVLSVLMSCAG